MRIRSLLECLCLHLPSVHCLKSSVCVCVCIGGVFVYTVCASDGDGECVLASSVFGPYPPRPVSVMGAC